MNSSYTQSGYNSGGANTSPTSFAAACNSWPAVDQLVAAVPVRPYKFQDEAQKISAGERRSVSEFRGTVPRPYVAGEEAEFFLLKNLLTDNEVAELLASGTSALSEVITTGGGREVDPVDGRPTFSMELLRDGRVQGSGRFASSVLTTFLEGSLLPYLRQKFNCPSAVISSAQFRRYIPEERRFLPAHHEYSAFATATIGLQDPSCVTGGLFVQGSGRAFLDRKFLLLGRGDVCVYRHDLHHGVEVQEGSLYELILHFKDSAKALSERSCPWYQKAADSGDASAQYALALSYLEQKDYHTARRWLDKACAQDYPEALHKAAELEWDPPSGSGMQADVAESLQLFRRAAELGYARSQTRLGTFLTQGVKGKVQQDSWEGKRLLRQAFEQDDPDAAFVLGQVLLQDGDRDGASKLMSACAKGHPRACFQAAEMYREAQHQFPKDVPQSIRYTKWAAHQGDAQALSNLGHLLINGVGVVRDDAKAVRLFRQAAKLGAAEGMLNYGLALLRGNGGVKVDYQEALQWAQKSAALGHNLAHQQLPMFFNAAKNPNPPARALPTSREELNSLGVRELRDFLRSEGIDFSDCVEKSDLVSRAAIHLPGVAEPWDAAPEHTLLLEAPKRSKEELLRQRKQQHADASDALQGGAAPSQSEDVKEFKDPEVVPQPAKAQTPIKKGIEVDMPPQQTAAQKPTAQPAQSENFEAVD